MRRNGLKQMQSITDKVIIITGASTGLGAELACQLSFFKNRLVLFSRQQSKLDEVAAVCRSNGSQVVVVSGDITQPLDCERLIQTTLENFQVIDVLVNNAGVSMWAKFADVTDLAIYESLIRVNYLGSVYCTYYSLPSLRENKGMIVNISSLQGRISVPFHTGYAASKHALQGFFDGLRFEETSVKILMVHPSWIANTQMRQSAFAADGGPNLQRAKRHKKNDLTPAVCARKIIIAMRRGRKALTLPGHYRILYLLRCVCNSLLTRIIKSKF